MVFVSSRVLVLLAVALVLLGAACGDSDDAGQTVPPTRSTAEPTTGPAEEKIDVGGRELYVRCSGSGSPTVIMEGGDGDTSDSYAFAEAAIAELTKTCVYDRANLGQSDPAPGPRQLPDLVGDLERLLEAGSIAPPYVLVGTSGGGYITAGFAYAHPEQVAGMVFVDTGVPLENPPREIVEETDPNNPTNIERRDYLQIERDAWAGRKEIGDIPVTILTVRFSSAAISESPFPVERRAMRRNVERQQGWLVLSPRAKQVVVNTSHAVEEDDPQLVIDAIADVVEAAKQG